LSFVEILIEWIDSQKHYLHRHKPVLGKRGQGFVLLDLNKLRSKKENQDSASVFKNVFEKNNLGTFLF
jgi:hypothetical protein